MIEPDHAATDPLEARAMLTPLQRKEFAEKGMLAVPHALSPEQVMNLTQAQDRVYWRERAEGRLGPDCSLHLLNFVMRDEAFEELLDLPSTFPLVWGLLGWNVYMYHCHLDVHPPVLEWTPRWGWHQDGGRQNIDLDDGPTRPLVSLKIAYFLSDASIAGRGNTMVIPGSHTRNTLPRPDPSEPAFEEPEGAVPLLAEPGTAVVFDRRLWHSRSPNRSDTIRRVLFLAYTYRWIRPRDEPPPGPHVLSRQSPIRRQLLGDSTGAIGHWIPTDDDVPLRTWLRERGFLESAGRDGR